jgi:hypothetical protein
LNRRVEGLLKDRRTFIRTVCEVELGQERGGQGGVDASLQRACVRKVHVDQPPVTLDNTILQPGRYSQLLLLNVKNNLWEF